MANTQSPKSDGVRTIAPEQAPSPVPHKPMTAGQQVALTIKLLVGAALLIALFWVMDRGI